MIYSLHTTANMTQLILKFIEELAEAVAESGAAWCGSPEHLSGRDPLYRYDGDPDSMIWSREQ